MVAAARYADQYDGFLAGNPGLQPAAGGGGAASVGAQQYATVARPTTEGLPDLAHRLHAGRARRWCRERVLARCDALDGAADGIVQDVEGLPGGVRPRARRADLRRRARRQLPDAPRRRAVLAQRCSPARATAAARRSTQLPVRRRHRAAATGARGSSARPRTLDAGAVAFIFGRRRRRTPPASDGPTFALGVNMDTMRRKIDATDAHLPRIAMSFMTPPEPSDLATLREPRRQDDRLPRHQRSGVLVATTPPPGTSACRRPTAAMPPTSRATSRCRA